MQFHSRIPRRDRVMPAKTEAPAFRTRFLQAGPATHGGMRAIGPGNPSRAHKTSRQAQRFAVKSRDWRAPGKIHAGRRGMIAKKAVKRGPPHSQAAALRKIREIG